MNEITNYVSRVLFKDKNCSYSILTYIDLDQELDENFINNYIKELLSKNSILQKTCIEKDENTFFLSDIKSFYINDVFNIEYTNKNTFDNYIDKLANKEFLKESKWCCLFCVDKDNKK
jgi:hypothetical protein